MAGVSLSLFVTEWLRNISPAGGGGQKPGCASQPQCPVHGTEIKSKGQSKTEQGSHQRLPSKTPQLHSAEPLDTQLE